MKFYKNKNDIVNAYEDNINEDLLNTKILDLGLTEITKIEATELAKIILSLANTKTKITLAVEKAFNDNTALITTALPHEMASWVKQENQAREWNADSTAITPFINELLITRNFGETKQELVNKIIGNADAYEATYGQLLGQYQNLISQIENATTIAEVEAITWVENIPPTT